MPAVLTYTFDPVLRLSHTASVRWETVGLAIMLFSAAPPMGDGPDRDARGKPA